MLKNVKVYKPTNWFLKYATANLLISKQIF